MKKNVVLGVTGGIAAYKAAELCSKLVKNNFAVKVIMTTNATQFVTPLTFQTLSKNPVITSLWEAPSWEPEHVDLATWCEIFVVAPATANFLAKMAHGIADDALSTFAVTNHSPVLIAPAMNPAMWSNPISRKNIEILEQIKVNFAYPALGHVACGDDGVGRMQEPEEIFAKIKELAE